MQKHGYLGCFHAASATENLFILGLGNWTLRSKLQWNFNQNTKIFSHENATENIFCEMAAIVYKGY